MKAFCVGRTREKLVVNRSIRRIGSSFMTKEELIGEERSKSFYNANNKHNRCKKKPFENSLVKLSLQPPPAASTSKKSNITLPDYQQTLSLTSPPLLATLLVSLPVLLPSRGEPSLASLPNSPASISYQTGHKAALSWHPPWAGCPRNMMGLVRSSTSPAQVQSNFRFPKSPRQCSVVHQHSLFPAACSASL